MIRNKSSTPKFGLRPMVILPLALLILCMSAGLTQAGTWTNAGAQTLDIDQDNYSMSETRYVSPGHTIRFDIYEITENDTNTPDCNDPNGTEYEEDDDQKQGRLKKTGGTVSEPWEETFSSTGEVSYTVPADACAGQTITIESQLHDTRDANDDRHDDWTTFETWEYVVSTDCPDSMGASMTDLSGGRPNAGESYGSYRATMSAVGDPPAGRENWNGTTVTESVGATEGDANDFKPGVIGITGESGSSFTFGSAGDNQFYDWHEAEAGTLILANGVNSATFTSPQTYTCSDTDDYDFTISRACNRLDPNTPNERIKITISK
ncbi:MAG: hypothetical protein OEW48_05750 [Phycisphaerae bacterium]|nr:hypothetical protein [Phycisphaerae bacterium]